MAVADTHPSIVELETLTLGTLDDALVTAVEAHVAVCPVCQERAAAASDDTLVELLRRVHTKSFRPNDTQLEAAVQATSDTMTVTLPPATPGDPARAEAVTDVPLELVRHDRYRVIRLLGAGGMGVVYEAEHRIMHRLVALKVINQTYTASAAAVERFRREVHASARLSHPNIVTAFDAENAGDLHFLVMEYVEGINLAHLVKARGPLPVAEACDCVRQAALGLQHAHERGMVHRDVKPANLIRCPDGMVKVLDFGLAMLASECGDRLTRTEVVMGTPDYMAPEQAEQAHSADVRADVYSLGCTLYYLLTGVVPYPADTPMLKFLAHRERPLPTITKARPDLPIELDRVMARMIAKKPQHRYQTPGEVAEILKPFMQTTSPTEKRRGSKRGGLVAAALLFFGLVVAGVVYRIQTDYGELIITSESDDVEVVIKQGGKEVKVIDGKTKKSITLRSGVYDLELKGAPEGLKLSIDKATLTRNGTELAKIERIDKKATEKIGEVRVFDGHTLPVRRVFFADGGRLALSAGFDKVLILWDVATGKEVRRFKGHRALIDSAALSHDNQVALSGGNDNTVRVWDVATGKELRQFKGNLGRVVSIAISPDGKRALTGSHDCTMRLWDIETGNELRRFNGHETQVQTVAFSPDGLQALYGSWEKNLNPTLKMFEVETSHELKRFEGYAAGVNDATFFPDGGRILCCGWDNTLRVWDASTARVLRTFESPNTWTSSVAISQDGRPLISSVAISQDGRRALSGSRDCTVRLWDVETGKELHHFLGHKDHVWCVAFSPDGRYALSGSDDATMRLWRLPDPDKP